MEGLHARPSLAADDTHRDGVSSALRPASDATWLRPYSAVRLSCRRLPHRTARARSAPAPTASALSAHTLDTTGLALPAMWSTDDHRPDPLRARADHHHARLRYLMSTHRCRPARRLRQRDRPRLRSRLSRTVLRTGRGARRTTTLDDQSGCRRRSRADGPSIHTGRHPKIPIPTP